MKGLTFGQVGICVLWIADAILMYVNFRLWRLRRTISKELAFMRENGLPPGYIEKIHRSVMIQVGLDADLMDRLLVDIQFMHGQLYRELGHTCPICESTLPDVEKWAASLHSMNIHVQQERSSHGDDH